MGWSNRRKSGGVNQIVFISPTVQHSGNPNIRTLRIYSSTDYRPSRPASQIIYKTPDSFTFIAEYPVAGINNLPGIILTNAALKPMRPGELSCFIFPPLSNLISYRSSGYDFVMEISCAIKIKIQSRQFKIVVIYISNNFGVLD